MREGGIILNRQNLFSLMFFVLIHLYCLIHYVFCESKLLPFDFQPLYLGEILPSGWLETQISIQASGLSGYIDGEFYIIPSLEKKKRKLLTQIKEYWSDVESSGWVGGWAEGWERFPYYLDGFFPLAILSRNEKLMEKAQNHLDYILSHQNDDGWFGPNPGKGDLGRGEKPKNDPWPSFIILKSLVQVLHSSSSPKYNNHHLKKNDSVIFEAMIKCVRKIDQVVTDEGLDKFEWAKYRLPDFVYVLQYLYDESPTSELLDLISKYTFDEGYDWFSHFENFTSYFTEKQRYEIFGDNLRDHGVNNAQAIKFPSLRYRLDHETSTSDLLSDWIISKLQKYHGTATGIIHGDELYAGLSPTQGTELCLIVEWMFSLELSLHILGTSHSWIGDLLEKIVYNNLPATLDETMNVHQYVQLDNQVIARRLGLSNFTDVGPHGLLFGVAPHFGCCTANYHQGWPKFVSHLWGLDLQGKLISELNSLVLLVHAPSIVRTNKIFLNNETLTVNLQVETDFPFGNGTGSIKVLSDTYPSVYGICYRIPGWASSSNKSSSSNWKCQHEAWKKGDVIHYEIDMKFHLSEYSYHSSVSLFRGPLLLSKSIDHESKKIHVCLFPNDKKLCEDYYDYEKLPKQEEEDDWNYGLFMDRNDPSSSILSINLKDPRDVEYPFSRDSPLVKIKVKGEKVSGWKLNEIFGIAGEVPYSPVKSTTTGMQEDIELVPMGSTDLRISVFPTMD